jgi:hypothetical protein
VGGKKNIAQLHSCHLQPKVQQQNQPQELKEWRGNRGKMERYTCYTIPISSKLISVTVKAPNISFIQTHVWKSKIDSLPLCQTYCKNGELRLGVETCV